MFPGLLSLCNFIKSTNDHIYSRKLKEMHSINPAKTKYINMGIPKAELEGVT